MQAMFYNLIPVWFLLLDKNPQTREKTIKFLVCSINSAETCRLKDLNDSVNSECQPAQEPEYCPLIFP
jgi:hypothetical protein